MVIDSGYVYILQSEKTGQYYVGSTKDVDRRLLEHNAGKTVFTRRGRPWKLMLAQRYESAIKARQVECKIKSLKRRDYLEDMVSSGMIKMR